ncbi:MAG: regulatory protein GemA [Oxalobacteraceae bacterium]|nr:regulatory protein GemA [Oxalobacteraceae bacterium]
MKPIQADALRKNELSKIHLAKKQLALADDEYRSIMLAITGKQSAADLDWQGRQKLLDHFKKIGFKVVAKQASRACPDVAPNRRLLIGKIAAQLAEAKLPWTYADAMAKRICKVDSITFCRPDHLIKIIAALSYDAKRHGRSEG